MYVSFATFFQVQGTAYLLDVLDVGQGVGWMTTGPGLQSTHQKAFVLPLHGHAPGLANIKTCALKSLHLTHVGFVLPVQTYWKNCFKP